MSQKLSKLLLKGVSQMKKSYLFNLTLLWVFVLSVQASLVQDYTRWGLPEGALARLGKGIIGEGDRAVSYSPDGTRIAVASRTGIWLYDANTGAEVALLQGRTGIVISVVYSPDGQTLASGSGDGTILLWDVTTGQVKTTLEGHTDWVSSVAYSSDGNTLASGSGDGTVRLWDVTTGEVKTTLEGHTDEVFSVSFSPDGQTLASGSGDGTVRLWDVTTGQVKAVLQGHTDWVNSVSFSPDGQTLASGSDDNTVRLWDVTTGQETTTLEGHTNYVTSISFSPDGQTLASGSWDNTVRLWDVTTGQETTTLEGHTNYVTSISFSPDGQTLASGSGDGTVRLWDVTTGQEKAVLQGHTDRVTSVSFSPDGNTLASGSLDGTVRLWDVTTGQEMITLEGHTDRVTSVSFSPDGQTLASGSGDGTARLWDVTTGQVKTTLEGPDWVNSVSFSPDGNTLASGSLDGTVRLWDVTTGQVKAVLQGHTDYVTSVSFSPDGQTLASGSGDGTVRLWDVTTGQVKAVLQGHTDWVNSVSFSPDGQTLASGSGDGTVRLWDVTTGQVKAVLQGHLDYDSVVYSPDGQTLASGSGSDDNTVWLWDVTTGQGMPPLQGHLDWIYSVSFSPDGQTLASGSLDGTILLWDMSPYTVAPAVTSFVMGGVTLREDVKNPPVPSGMQQFEITFNSPVKDNGILLDPDLGELEITFNNSNESLAFIALPFALLELLADAPDLAMSEDRLKLTGTVNLPEGATYQMVIGPSDVASIAGLQQYFWGTVELPDAVVSGVGILPEGFKPTDEPGGVVLINPSLFADSDENFLETASVRISYFSVAESLPEQLMFELKHVPDGSYALFMYQEAVDAEGNTVVLFSFQGLGLNYVAFMLLGLNPSMDAVDSDKLIHIVNGESATDLQIMLEMLPEPVEIDEVSVRGVDVENNSFFIQHNGQQVDVDVSQALMVTLDPTNLEEFLVAILLGDFSAFLEYFFPITDLRVGDTVSISGLPISETAIQATFVIRLTPSLRSADLDGDGDVDFSDFLLFAAAFGTREGGPGYNAAADLDGDGTVAFSDFLIFANAFGNGHDLKEPAPQPYEILWGTSVGKTRDIDVPRPRHLKMRGQLIGGTVSGKTPLIPILRKPIDGDATSGSQAGSGTDG